MTKRNKAGNSAQVERLRRSLAREKEKSAALARERKEAREQQAAAAEILKVISRSPSDAQPVFDAIVKRALRLMRGHSAVVTRVVDGMLHMGAFTSTGKAGDAAMQKGYPRPIEGKSVGERAVRSGRPISVGDTEKAPASQEHVRRMGRLRGYRSIVAIPMLREGMVIGSLNVTRTEPQPFSKQEINLLQTFAQQAVIAIENVRLFNETKEALERQTATAEILEVIASSPSDVQPVFDAIAKRSMRLIGGSSASVVRVMDGNLYLAALTSTNQAGDEGLRRLFPAPISAMHIYNIVIRSRAPYIRPDTETASDITSRGRELARARGYRSQVGVPMLRETDAIGAIVVARPEPGPFSEHQIGLLQTFASQAVIAIENVRLFKELEARNREVTDALERQTATAEILKVIASSPSNVQPVFEAIAESAMRLIGGLSAAVATLDNDMIHLAAFTTTSPEGDEVVRSTFPRPLSGPSHLSIALRTGSPRWVADTEADPELPPETMALARARGFRSTLAVPMMRGAEAIGVLNVTRRAPGTFSDHQIGMLKTFADQAAIAIENVRLFNETKEALERQTVTAEVLQVIGSSVADTAPVFDKIIRSCEKLFGVRYANVALIGDDGLMHLVQEYSSADLEEWEITNRKLMQSEFPRPVRDSAHGYAIYKREVLHYPDVLNRTDVPKGLMEFTERVSRAAGQRIYSLLFVPMFWEGKGIGAIGLIWHTATPFAEQDIRLLKTFADQAAIAIQNARLFNETKEALERQTATAEVLRVISSSPTDTQPVFEAIAQSGLRLFPGAAVAVVLPAGGQGHAAAIATEEPAQAVAWRSRFPHPLTRDYMHGVAILEHRVVDVPDVEAEVDGPMGRGARNFLASGNKAVTIVPMIRGEHAIGVISVVRAVTGPLKPSQIALLQTFADQAVIAIENVRLFKELEARTEALGTSVQKLTALGEVGQAISSTLDLETVLKTIVSHAVLLTGLDGGAIYEYDEQAELFHLRASEKLSDELAETLRGAPIRKGDGAVGETAVTRAPIQIPETHAESYKSRLRELTIRAGRRALLAVPLLREGRVIGALAVQRNTPGPFAPETVELLQTFATQSAMAIQNARLFREIAEKGKQLEVASHHKSQFLASMSHELRTPLNALLGFNEMILGDVYGEVPPDMQPPLAQMQASGKHLLRLINNVLDLAKIEAGRMELALSDYSVQDTVDAVRSTLRPLAAEKGLEFVATVPADIPLAYGDPGRITQCLMNLAGNALKFTKVGKVEIRVSESGRKLSYCVADTGVGIPPDKMDGLFTEFKQTDATVASEYGGTGLGLSISKKFVEMHGGRIWAESAPGRGSTFVFEIPLRAGERTEA